MAEAGSDRCLVRIVSGGQTGADRAALDVAIDVGTGTGGWCPRGRLAEDGRIDDRYPLIETPSARYEQRTRWNVRDSDGTLVLASGPLSDGTAGTIEEAERIGRPFLRVDPARDECEVVRAWIAEHKIRTLNVAGPRESTQPGIYDLVYAFLRKVLAAG